MRYLLIFTLLLGCKPSITRNDLLDSAEECIQYQEENQIYSQLMDAFSPKSQEDAYTLLTMWDMACQLSSVQSKLTK